MANKFTGITSAGVNVPVYDKEAHQALGNVYTKSEVDTELNTKQDNLSSEQLYNIDNALTTSAGLASEAWVNNQGFAKESDIPTTAGLMEESKLNIESNHITAYNGIPFSAQGGGGGGGTVYTDSSLSGNGAASTPLGLSKEDYNLTLGNGLTYSFNDTQKTVALALAVPVRIVNNASQATDTGVLYVVTGA